MQQESRSKRHDFFCHDWEVFIFDGPEGGELIMTHQIVIALIFKGMWFVKLSRLLLDWLMLKLNQIDARVFFKT